MNIYDDLYSILKENDNESAVKNLCSLENGVIGFIMLKCLIDSVFVQRNHNKNKVPKIYTKISSLQRLPSSIRGLSFSSSMIDL